MDPNQTLKDIRALVVRVAVESDEELPVTAEELATLVQALDEWLSSGGFLPEAWDR